MARVRKDQPLKPSILDRLVRDPSSTAMSSGLVLQQVKESVRRDLEDLLNTRRCCASWSPELDALNHSLVHYGLKDFSGSSLGSPDEQELFRRDIQDAIRLYEPRLSQVVVKQVRENPADRTVHFRIEAVLEVDPAPVPVVFDSSLEPLSATFAVEGGG